MRERLYRSRRDRVIGGLAAGLAHNLGVDVAWVRIGWVVLAFATQGAAILIYLVLLFVVPEEPEILESADSATTGTDENAMPGEPSGLTGARTDDTTTWASADRPATEARRAPPPPPTVLERLTGSRSGGDSSRSAALVVGLVLVAAGAWILLRRYIAFDFDLGWPVVAIVVGVLLVLAAMRTGGRSG